MTNRQIAQLATEIRIEMTRQRRTLDDAGAAFGFSGSAISRKLAGTRALTVADLFRFADWLSVPAAELVARAESQTEAVA